MEGQHDPNGTQTARVSQRHVVGNPCLPKKAEKLSPTLRFMRRIPTRQDVDKTSNDISFLFAVDEEKTLYQRRNEFERKTDVHPTPDVPESQRPYDVTLKSFVFFGRPLSRGFAFPYILYVTQVPWKNIYFICLTCFFSLMRSYNVETERWKFEQLI